MADKKDAPAPTKKSPVANNGGSRPAAPRYMPDAKECALLLLRLIQAKEEDSGRPLSRFRVAEISLTRMWGRHRITPEFIEDVNEWLLRAGRVLFYAGSSYGVILVSAVESWSRLSSKRIALETDRALAGDYDFSALEELLNAGSGDTEDEG
jgi:hypothetical protein